MGVYEGSLEQFAQVSNLVTWNWPVIQFADKLRLPKKSHRR